MAKSTAFAPHALHGMLYGGIHRYCLQNRKDVAPNALWTGGDEHKKWLDAIHQIAPGYEQILGKRMKTFGSPSKDECNAFLKAEGFDIQLEDFVGINPVGGICTLHIGVEWEYAGEETVMYLPDNTGGYGEYPAATLTGGISYLKSAKHESPIAEISTKGPEKVFMTIADQELDGLALLDRIAEIADSAEVEEHSYYEGLRFPKISLDVQPDISSLCGIMLPTLIEKPYELYQALMQVKFRANHLGAQTDAAAAGQAGMESGPSYLVMHKPFYVWKTLPGLNLPVLVARVDSDSWKDPGDFELNNG